MRSSRLEIATRFAQRGVAIFVGIEFEFYRLRDRFNLAPQPQRISLLGACDESMKNLQAGQNRGASSPVPAGAERWHG